MSKEATVRLRDRRMPNHGWYDNEVFDVFGDELGAMGIHVYVTMTRLSYGTTVTMGLRKLAEHARMTKDTFARNLKRVIALGLVIERKGMTPQSMSTYELVDVKDLAAKYLRAAMEEQRAAGFPSRVLSVSPIDTRPASTLAQLVGVAIQERMEAVAEDDAKCLSGRHTGCDDFFLASDEVATEVSQNGAGFETEVSHQVRHLRQDTRLQDTKQVPAPVVPASGDVACEQRTQAELEAKAAEVARQLAGVSEQTRLEVACLWGATQVVHACGMVANRRVQAVMADALALHCRKAKCDAPTATKLAVANVKAYQEAKPTLAFQWGWRKFFAEGHWVDPDLWPMDKAASRELQLAAKASIGMYQPGRDG